MGLKNRHWALLILVALPLPLTWHFARVIRERPHPLLTRDYGVNNFYFPEDGQSVCLEEGGNIQCYSKSTRKPVKTPFSASPGIVDYGGRLQHRGSFYFCGILEKDEIFYGFKDKQKKLLLFDKQEHAAFSPDNRIVALASDKEIKHWDFRQNRFFETVHLEQPTTKGRF